MNTERLRISVLEPVSPAISRARKILFEPFDLGKWFVIGFCAWLAFLSTPGVRGGGPNVNPGGRFQPAFESEDMRGQAEQLLHAAREYLAANLFWIVPVVIIVGLFLIALWLVVTWLSSRGRFMFLHCVARNKAEVKAPWSQFRRHGNSLFLFRIVVGLIGFAAIMLALILGALLAIMMMSDGLLTVGAVSALILIGLFFFVVSIVLLVIKKFTTDFVVPIMFLRTESCRAAWREFLAVLSVNKARFLLYLLFQIVIKMAISVIIAVAGCATCCIACCIIGIPYIGTVLLLPILIFERSYSLCYVRQFGPRFDVFESEVEIPSAGQS